MLFVCVQKPYMEKNKINIAVAFAGERSQIIIPLQMQPGSLLQDAILQSGIMQKHPELSADQDSDSVSQLSKIAHQVGVFGELKPLDTLLNEGDRIEIYRKLKIDPKEARKLRAKALRINKLDILRSV